MSDKASKDPGDAVNDNRHESDNVSARLEVLRNDCQVLELKLSQLTEPSVEYSDVSSRLNILQREILLLETRRSSDEASAVSREPETVSGDHAPIPPCHMATAYDDSKKKYFRKKSEESKTIATVSQQMNAVNEISAAVATTTNRVPAEHGNQYVGATAMHPPSFIEINQRNNGFDENNVQDENVRFSTVSGLSDPTMDSFSAMPILRATLVTEPDTVDKESIEIEPVYDAVQVCDEHQPFYKRHRLSLLLVCIIFSLAAAILGIIFGQRSDSVSSSTTILRTYSPSLRPSTSSQPSSCGTYRIISTGAIFADDKVFMSPVVGIDENYIITVRPYNERAQFFQSLDDSQFKGVGTFPLDSDLFVYSAAISGDFAVVGTPTWDNFTGRAYIFENNFSSGTWDQVMQIEFQNVTENITDNAWFGVSVDINEDVVAIGTLDDARGGSTFIYRLINGAWELEEEIVLEDTVFAETISIEKDHIAIGDYLNGDDEEGVVFIYKFDSESSSWDQFHETIRNDDCTRHFGLSVALAEDMDLIIMCGGETNSYGAIYVYSLTDINDKYEFQQKIVPTDGSFQNSVNLSYRIAVNGNKMLVATYEGDNGIVHIFTKENNRWTEVNKILAPDALNFGEDFDISGNTVLVSSAHNVHSYTLEDC